MLLEHSAAPQPVRHPCERLAFLEVARPAVVVTATPRPDPLTVQGSFLELEALVACAFADVHTAMVARRCDVRRGFVVDDLVSGSAVTDTEWRTGAGRCATAQRVPRDRLPFSFHRYRL